MNFLHELLELNTENAKEDFKPSNLRLSYIFEIRMNESNDCP